MATLASLRRELETVQHALNIDQKNKIIHKVVFVDPVTNQELTNCPPFYCYSGFTPQEEEELRQQHTQEWEASQRQP